eukprot:m.55030 g.55030  ORF g.55030 m.55030 type:complete len:635 (+) comp7735_c0_seq5:74-1978(+)
MKLVVVKMIAAHSCCLLNVFVVVLVGVVIAFDCYAVASVTTSLASSSASISGTVYWWRYNQTDCGGGDISQGCEGMSVEACEQICLNTTGCMGFNTHGWLKTSNCPNNLVVEDSVDLYLQQTKPQPPPPPPLPPTTNWPPIWPLPREYTNGSSTIMVDASTFKFSGPSSTDLSNAFSRYTSLMFSHKQKQSPSSGAITSAQVSVGNVSVPLQWGVSENYTLTIPSDGSAISISADTVYGAYHAMETLSQLISFDFDLQMYVIHGAPWNIDDSPRFSHREVLIDSSRHFEPVESLKEVVDSLTYAKINVIHWHLVDEQSFPFISPTYPKLAKYGAWTPGERYTVSDVADVVEYARQRGVRVYVEIDTPGHAGCWCNGHPEICPSPNCTMPLNPATEATFTLLSGLFKDVTGGARGQGLFPDNMMHLGGDEVNTKCWTETPSIVQWMEEHNFTADQTYEYFVNRTQAIAHSYERDVIGWEEIWNHFGTTLDKSTIIHQWLPGSSAAQQATDAGYRALWSTDGVWYLDGLGVTWETMYAQEPCTGIADKNCGTLLLGGGGCMWGETVDTSDIQQTIWPRLGAIAERLWSPRGYTDINNARPRFESFRCLLNKRGVAAAPSNNAEAREAPSGPGSCNQ